MGKGTSSSTQDNQTTQSSQENQTQNQSGTVAPWAPTQGILQNILNGIGGQGYAPTGAENTALGMLSNNAQNTGNYGGQATGLANSLLSGGGAQANAGILGDAYKNYQNQLNPIANQNNDPRQNPGMADILSTIRNDVGNSVNGMFAGAGRDMSGLNQQSLARGISQGEAVPLLNQYNQNVQNQMGAAGGLFGAGGQTASGLQGFNQQGFQNQATGLDTAMNGIPAAQNNQAMQMLQAAQMGRQLPMQNLGMLSNLTIPIAGLGSQSYGTGSSSGSMTGRGTSNTQGTQTASPMQMALMGSQMFKNLFPMGL